MVADIILDSISKYLESAQYVMWLMEMNQSSATIYPLMLRIVNLLFFIPFSIALTVVIAFFAEYTVTPSKNMDIFEGHLCKVHPAIPTISTFSDRIEKISPKFIEIYHQSEIAENTGLIEICGMGYRKALEFLVKDYAIAFNPDNESEIRNSNLSPCISNFIDNKRIKSLAMASAWIGNDETHYTRKHEDYDVGHLKLFISAVVSHIDSELAYRMAERLLSAPKK